MPTQTHPVLRIDVETSASVKTGSGPITTATGWRQIHNMDRLGSFSFSMPASDPRAALLVSRAVVRARYDGAEVGSGIVDHVELDLSGDVPMLAVSGNDLGQELTWWDVPHLPIWEAGHVRPVDVFIQHIHDNAGDGSGDGNPVAAPAAFDGNPATYSEEAVEADGDSTTSRGYYYVGSVEPFTHLDFILSNPAAGGAGPGRWQFFDGAGWVSLTLTADTTAVGGETLLQTGTVTWAAESTWLSSVQGAVTAYYVRFRGECGSNRRICEIVAPGHVPTATALALLTALWTADTLGPAWELDAAAGFTTTAKADVYGLLEWQNHVAALGKLAELTGEHWYIGSGRHVVWARNLADFADTGLRAIVAPDPDAIESDVCLITRLTRTRETYERCACIYPYGAGLGTGKLDLTNVTDAAPAGYTLATIAGYPMVYHTAGYAALAGWHGVSMKEIGPSTVDQRAREYAANQLLAAAVVWLERHRGENYAYSLEVAHVPQVIYPCQTIHVVYHRWVDGYHAVSIDADLVVLSSTTQIDNTGIQTVALTVSTIDAWPLSDTEVLARLVKQALAMGVYPQPVEVGGVNSQTFGSSGVALTVGGGGLTTLRTG
jgi:hypothetical protein